MPVPTATYRIQFNPAFGFRQAIKHITYLKTLGISDLYASPIFKAKKGSTHGYDVIDPGGLNPELGRWDDFQKLSDEVNARGMGWIQDIVPNHMAFDGDNVWLMDVFEKGKKSPYFKVFDIEWKDTYQNLKGKVLAPFLGQFYSRCLENKEIQIRYADGNLTVHYHDLRFPLKIETYQDVLARDASSGQHARTGWSKTLLRFREEVKKLKLGTERPRSRYGAYLQSIKSRIWLMYRKNLKIKKYVDRNIASINGQRGDAAGFHLLDQLLEKQRFRLTFWKFGSEEINYRRFFNINQLITVRVEDKKVFDQTHGFIFDLMRQGKISGLRIDHIDGLYDPKKYLQRLRQHGSQQYIVVEKILEGNERLPDAWPVEGTTGYEFMNCVNGLFVDRANQRPLTSFYESLAAANGSFNKLVSGKKRLILGKHMAGDVDNLAHHIKRISHKDRCGHDITYYGLKRALVEVMALFPCYRTYVDSDSITSADESVIKKTIARAKNENPGLIFELDFIAGILTLKFKEYLTKTEKDRWIHFVRRFQQFTGPLMAKGFEDTVLYVYNRLISLNEVGGNPNQFGVSVENFHQFNRSRRSKWPHAMSTTATHDTKRGEDARARINVLSEMPAAWQQKVKLWQRLNREKKKNIGGKTAPDDNDEYFLYQSMLGGFPFLNADNENFARRLKDYAVKAVREAKVHTAWIQPDEQYERAYREFIDGILKPSKTNYFLKDFHKFKSKIARYGIFNSLSQTLLKLTAVGVPDFYQGCELWDFSFVDPDNRRGVDFEKRSGWLASIAKKYNADSRRCLDELWKQPGSGRVKLFLIWRMLHLRHRREEIFQRGRYVPLEAAGQHKDSVIAFARKHKRRYVITIAARFLTRVVKRNQMPTGRVWGNTRVILPERRPWREWITNTAYEGKKLFLKDIFKRFPGAVLIDDHETR